MKIGSLVRHTREFLRSVCWYTNVPINGLVRELDEKIVTVEWNDGYESRVHVDCLEELHEKTYHANIRVKKDRTEP